MSDKDTSFDITKVREWESGCKNVKLTQDVCEKPWFEQEWKEEITLVQ